VDILIAYIAMTVISLLLYNEKLGYDMDSEFGFMIFFALIWPVSLPLAIILIVTKKEK